ncbi:MAG TPA: HAD family phosphatase [Gaiellales bacterium]|nr:HAD family phosphatase [Gaiellales bacterium]
MTRPNFRAFIFDLDGTLVETERLKALSYAWAARELRPRLSEDEAVEAFAEFVGQTRDEMARNLTARLGLEEAARARMAEFGAGEPWQVLSVLRTRRYDGVLGDPELLRRQRYPHNIELLHWARRHEFRTALCSMSHRTEIDRVLDALGLAGCFEVIASVDDVARAKPDPEIDLLVAGRLGVTPAECLVIEDSPPGVQAARAAGMAVIAVTTALTRRQFRDHELLDRRWVVDDPGTLRTVVQERLAEAV